MGSGQCLDGTHQGLAGISGLGQWFGQMGRNIEMTNYTQALYDARELSMERMQNEAVSLKSEGIVGAQIVERNHGWGSHIIEFFAVGTAVISISQDHQIPEPSLSLLLNSSSGNMFTTGLPRLVLLPCGTSYTLSQYMRPRLEKHSR